MVDYLIKQDILCFWWNYVGDNVNGVGWNQQGSFGKRANRTIDWGDGPPSTITSQAEGDVWIDYHDPSLLKVYTYIAKQGGGFVWQSGKIVKGIGPMLIQMLKIQIGWICYGK